MSEIESVRPPWFKLWPLWTLAASAVLVGLYGRFKGLGHWPLGVDEFYISRSIDHVLSTGLPQFPCGGYYMRGLSYQYIVALVRWLGATPEFAGRWVSAMSSLAVLPAAYLIGRRLHGRVVGLLVVIVLALSVWEIEMARFARMYAPFQAVFAWYLVYFLRYTVDGDRKALRGMVLLSFLGVLTWEGGVLIGLANFLPAVLRHRNGRWQRADWLYCAGMSVLLGALFFISRDRRGGVDAPALDAATAAGTGIAPAVPDAATESLVHNLSATFAAHPLWLALALVPLAFACGALPWIASQRQRWLAAAGLGAALAAALFHVFVLCGAILLLLLLTRLCEWRELTARPARLFWAAILSSAVFWIAYGLMIGDWSTGTVMGTLNPYRSTVFAQHLLGFPNVWEEVIRPWGRTLPLLTVGLFAALLVLIAREIRLPNASMRASLVLLIAMLLAVGASGTERIETRYTFFLYPLLVALAITAIALLSERLGAARPWLTAGIALLLFAATEDFQPWHVIDIDTNAVAFRLGMGREQRDHYYSHNDLPAAARWLTAHAHSGRLIVNSIPSLDQYYTHTDRFYLNEDDSRYDAYTCPDGRTERWTNRSLYAIEDVRSAIAAGGSVFLVIYPFQKPRLLEAAATYGWHQESEWTSQDGGIRILLLSPPAGTPRPVAVPSSNALSGAR